MKDADNLQLIQKFDLSYKTSFYFLENALDFASKNCSCFLLATHVK